MNYRPVPARIATPPAPPVPRKIAAGWLPEKERDTRWYLFYELYAVNVPYLQTRSIEDIQHFGVPTSGDPEVDRAMMNEIRQVMVPIQRLAEWYKKGVQIGVVCTSDTKRIYQRISNHLEAWKHHLTKSLNIGKAPLEDLLLLDKFAHSVYEFAKYEFQDEGFIESLIMKTHMSSLSGSLNQLEQRILNPVVQPATAPALPFRVVGDKTFNTEPLPEEVKEEELPARRSMAEFFTPRQAGTVANTLNNAKAAPPAPNRSVSPSIAALLGRAGTVDK